MDQTALLVNECAVVGDSSLPLEGSFSGAASDSRDARPTIVSGYRVRLADTQDPSPASGDENPRVVGVDNPADHKPAVGDDSEKAQTSFDNKDKRGAPQGSTTKSLRRIEPDNKSNRNARATTRQRRACHRLAEFQNFRNTLVDHSR